MRARARIGAGVAVVFFLGSRAARAQGEGLRQEADRVAEEWRKGGAVVAHGPSRFLYDNETMTIALPPPETSEQACTTVAILGGRGVSFHARDAGREDDPLNDDPQTRASSIAGVLEIGGCDKGASPLERLRVTSDAGRGAIETVVARSAHLPAPIRTVLPERTGGALPPPPDAGTTPTLPPPEKRADLAEARGTREGATALPRAAWGASGDGSGDVKIPLESGCHRIELFAVDARGRAARRRRLDVDAEIRDDDEDLLARDRTDNADARLELCVGEPTDATVIFAGAPAETPVTVTHAWWPVPAHLPSLGDGCAGADGARPTLAEGERAAGGRGRRLRRGSPARRRCRRERGTGALVTSPSPRSRSATRAGWGCASMSARRKNATSRRATTEPRWWPFARAITTSLASTWTRGGRPSPGGWPSFGSSTRWRGAGRGAPRAANEPKRRAARARRARRTRRDKYDEADVARSLGARAARVARARPGSMPLPAASAPPSRHRGRARLSHRTSCQASWTRAVSSGRCRHALRASERGRSR